jgi:hypothetical protein
MAEAELASNAAADDKQEQPKVFSVYQCPSVETKNALTCLKCFKF